MAERWHVISENEVGRLDGEPLADDSGMDNLMSLARAHGGYQDAEGLNSDQIAKLTERIEKLEAERQKLVTERDGAVSSQGTDRSTYASRVEKLANLEAGWVNPIYAAVLRGIAIDQGSLWYPESLLAGDNMGKELVVADRYLVATKTPQPVIGLSYVYSNPHHQQIEDLHLVSGQTIAGKGFNVRLEEDTQRGYRHRSLHLDLLVVQNGIKAVLSSSLGSYRTSDAEIFKSGEDGELQITVNEYETSVPERPKGISIPLPNGNIYMVDERVVMLHGNEEYEIVETHGYGQGVRHAFEKRMCAVGAGAVKRALVDMHKLCTEASNRQHSELFKEVAMLSAQAIGVVMKSSDFKKTPTAIPVSR